MKPIIYCGPNLNGELQKFSIHKDIPKHIERHIKKCPAIEEMFVSTKDLVKVRRKINEKGSKENQLYSKILEYLKEG